MAPKISVIVPCYNQEKYLDDTLKSVKKQTHSNWECIIVDDGSTDNSQAIAKTYCDSDPRFIYLFKQNGGLSSARNFGLGQVSGKYIQLLDADDLIKPEKFAEQLIDLQLCQISICDYFSFVDGTNDAAPHRYLSPFLSELNYKLEIITDWEYKKSIPCHTVLFEKKLVDKYNLRFNEQLPNHEDWVFWVQLFYYSKAIKNNKGAFALYRIHKGSMSYDFKLMREGFLKAAKILQGFFKIEKEKELFKASKEKYKEVYNKTKVPFLKKIKSRVYSKLVYIYKYVRKN